MRAVGARVMAGPGRTRSPAPGQPSGATRYARDYAEFHQNAGLYGRVPAGAAVRPDRYAARQAYERAAVAADRLQRRVAELSDRLDRWPS